MISPRPAAPQKTATSRPGEDGVLLDPSAQDLLELTAPLVGAFMPPSAQRFILAGAPLVCFVAGGSYVLSQFTKGTVEARDIKTKSRSVKAFALSEEHAKIERKLHGAEGPSASELILKRIPRKE